MNRKLSLPNFELAILVIFQVISECSAQNINLSNNVFFKITFVKSELALTFVIHSPAWFPLLAQPPSRNDQNTDIA